MIACIGNALDKLRDNPWRIAKRFARNGWLDFLPDKVYLSILYRANLGKWINWNEPRTYTEKLQWLKVYDRREIYEKMVDKYEAKQYIADRVGGQYVPALVGGPWKCFEEINFDSLPEQFVLKTTHDCGGVWICKDKSKLDVNEAKCFINKHLKQNYYRMHREWSYKNIQPRIFAEEYLEDLVTGELRDYKFFTFNGVPKMLFVASERQTQDVQTKFDFFDMDFSRLPIVNGQPNSSEDIPKPVCFERMKEISSVLSNGTPQLRVDFFECNGRLYVGELTFFHYAGFVPFEPNKWDEVLGEWLVLPRKS